MANANKLFKWRRQRQAGELRVAGAEGVMLIPVITTGKALECTAAAEPDPVTPSIEIDVGGATIRHAREHHLQRVGHPLDRLAQCLNHYRLHPVVKTERQVTSAGLLRQNLGTSLQPPGFEVRNAEHRKSVRPPHPG